MTMLGLKEYISHVWNNDAGYAQLRLYINKSC